MTLPKVPFVTNAKYDWYSLDIRRQRRRYYRPKRIRETSAVDTETVDGQAFLVADDRGDYAYIDKWSDVIDFVFLNDRNRYTNFMYNLDYDTRALLSHLDDDALFTLWTESEYDIAGTMISYLPSKYLAFSRDKKRVEFFDLAQFFYSSLDKASLQYLGEGKSDIDGSLIDASPLYRMLKRDEIREYCIRDALLTKKLADVTYRLFDSIGIESNRWYSKGYIAERFFLKHTRFPRLHFKAPQRYAYLSYAGGRFEVFRRGYHPQVYKYDISSAYPYAMTTLPDLDLGTWRHIDHYDPSADMAFVRVLCASNEGYVQPLHRKLGELVTYPVSDLHLRILTKTELDFILDYDLADIDVLDGWHFYADDDSRPFAIIHDIYDKRQALKQADDVREKVLKIVMNSIYGKQIQVNPRRPDETLFKTGNLFIPAYASVITATTRIELLRQCRQHDIRPIAFFTDAIVTTEPLPLKGVGLGKWDLEAKGEGVFLGSGVYTIRDGDEIQTKLRGFRSRTDIDLFSLLEENASRSSIELYNRRPVTMGEFVHRFLGKDIMTMNRWLEREKRININFDRKRRWNRPFVNCIDALRHSIDSEPLNLVSAH